MFPLTLRTNSTNHVNPFLVLVPFYFGHYGHKHEELLGLKNPDKVSNSTWYNKVSVEIAKCETTFLCDQKFETGFWSATRLVRHPKTEKDDTSLPHPVIPLVRVGRGNPPIRPSCAILLVIDIPELQIIMVIVPTGAPWTISSTRVSLMFGWQFKDTGILLCV